MVQFFLTILFLLSVPAAVFAQTAGNSNSSGSAAIGKPIEPGRTDLRSDGRTDLRNDGGSDLRSDGRTDSRNAAVSSDTEEFMKSSQPVNQTDAAAKRDSIDGMNDRFDDLGNQAGSFTTQGRSDETNQAGSFTTGPDNRPNAQSLRDRSGSVDTQGGTFTGSSTDTFTTGSTKKRTTRVFGGSPSESNPSTNLPAAAHNKWK